MSVNHSYVANNDYLCRQKYYCCTYIIYNKVNKGFRILAFIILALAATVADAQIDGLTDNTTYNVELSGTFTDGDHAPFWLTSNCYGLSTIEPNSGYLRAGISRPAENDSLLNWRYGYGIDLAVPVNFTSDFVVQQLYGEVQFHNFRMTVGAKEIPQSMLNTALSSGGMTLSNNYRPIPQVRFDLAEWWTWHFTGDWLAVKGHLAYGIHTDNAWQKDFVAPGRLYTKNSLFHSKAGYMRIGNDEKLPISATIGLEMASQFGGRGFNLTNRDDNQSAISDVDLGNQLKDFWDAFIPGGNDVNDGDYKNVAGNQLGNWYLELMYKGNGWDVKAYAEHFFEDHSQMFVQYGWKDMLWGLEANLPDNPFVSDIVAEYLYTKDQTGGLYHDENELLPIQISGKDNYYSHHVYGAWQHWGQNVGNPLLLSPIYNNGMLLPQYNRVSALHFGIAGNPTNELHYRLLYSNLRTIGTYDFPTLDPLDQNYFMAELTYKPVKLKGWSATASFGFDEGDLIGNNTGFSLSISKTGILF